MSRHSRRVALGLIAVAALLAFVTASGAFSSVSAERAVQVTVTGDEDALLGLAPHTGPNGAYAQLTGDQLELVVDGTNTVGSGVNPNAVTTIRDVFNVTNQGTQEVAIWFEKSGNHAALVTFENASGVGLDNTSAAAQPLEVGETLEVGLVIDTTGQSLAPGTSLLDGVTIHANATAS